MASAGRHLLLIACSRRKRVVTEYLPAVDRYDGNAYRVMRKVQREDHWPFLVDVVILSAEFGLIDAGTPIPYYERRMDQARAAELRPSVLTALQERLNGQRQYADVYVDLGQDYLPAIDEVEDLCRDVSIVYAKGRIGQRLRALREWLLERWVEQPIVPFFVADRPMSLKILKGLPLREYPNARIGIMAHANTTANFQEKLFAYPCEDPDDCGAIGGEPCPHSEDVEECPARAYILDHTIKMCDSGIFTREGATLSHGELFEAYERMGVAYGVMIDVFQDSEATLHNAEEALEAYRPHRGRFHLVGVAQGNAVEEYLACYRALKEMGFTHVAVGGLLRRVKNSVRYTQVRNESVLYDVLNAIRAEYPHDWLFALGCLHPSRLAEFSRRQVWGDYKGWIFQYEKKDDTLDALLETLSNNDLEHLDAGVGDRLSDTLPSLEKGLDLRDTLRAQRQETHQSLVAGRKSLREHMAWLYSKVQRQNQEKAALLEPALTHALLSKKELGLVKEAIGLLRKRDRERRGAALLSQARTVRALKKRIKVLEKRLGVVNAYVGRVIEEMARQAGASQAHLVSRCEEIARLIRTSERTHRFNQVHQDVATRILQPIVQTDNTV